MADLLAGETVTHVWHWRWQIAQTRTSCSGWTSHVRPRMALAFCERTVWRKRFPLLVGEARFWFAKGFTLHSGSEHNWGGCLSE